MAGRGYGKTRIGAEQTRADVKRYQRCNIIGATADDARDIMVEGESGILAICSADERPEYQSQRRRLLWPNGATTLIFTADEPDRLRGKQHERLWCDEIAAWRYATDAWDQAMFGLRLGSDPRVVATTTPKPVQLVRSLIADPTCVVTRGSTFANRANLSPAFFSQIINRYSGTRTGRQEIDGELLDDVEGAAWRRSDIDSSRVCEIVTTMTRVVIGVDPAVTSGTDSAETGIIAAAIGADGHGYVLADRSLRGTPAQWAEEAVTAYHAMGADLIVVEDNQGGEMCEATLRTVAPTANIKRVHASRGKATRAEPVAALYEQGRIHHVGRFDALEDQMCSYVPGAASPDRLDALVHALTELMLQSAYPMAL